MLLPLNDDIIKKGFCWGEYEVTVDTGPRIRLNRPIIRGFKGHKVKKIWRYLDPTGPRMIICPAQHREIYIKAAMQNFPSVMGVEEAYRKFICTGEPVLLKDHGRISITEIFNQHIKITSGQQVVILGVGLWYEVWKRNDRMRKANVDEAK